MRFIGICFLTAFAASGMYAQSTLNQQISGHVTDPTGAALPETAVTITSQDTGLVRSTKTNVDGFYVLPDLPTGRYRVVGEAKGFGRQTVDGNQLNTNVSIEVDLKLQVGSQAEEVTVQADALVLETTSGEVGYTVTGAQASELQLNGRNFPELLALLPGVSTTYTDGFSLFGGYGVNNSAQSINGGRTDSTTWNLDGADNKDNGGGGNNFININPDAIGEFRALTSNYSAESGTSSGAVVNLSIRSGTKRFRGRLYEYWRNDHLTATAFNGASVPKPKLRWNNYGGNIGGPIVLPFTKYNRNRDKLFFFYSQDMKTLRTATTSTWTVPTASQKSGSFGATVIRDPETQTPFPGNVLPASRINPSMQKMVNIYPLANQGTANYVFNAPQPSDVHQEVFKVDHNLNANNQINFHWVHDYYEQLNNITNLVEYMRQIPGLNTSIQWNKVVTPTWVNVLQFSYSGNVIIEQKDVRANPLFLKDFTREGFGIALPTIYGASNVIPQVAIQTYTTLSATPLAFNNFNRIFSLKENLTKVAGNHTLKMGAMLMRSRKNQDNPPAINGQFNFSNARRPSSSNGLADALLGAFQQYTEFPSVRQGWYRFTQVEPYFQDDWKVTRHLTVNMGLRWSYMQPQYSALNNTAQFLPEYYDASKAAVLNASTGVILSAPSPYNGLVIPGDGFPEAARGRVIQYADPAVKALFHNLPQGGARTVWGNFAPRLGFAYAWDANTVIRGGYGVSYERIQGNFIFSAINNSPFNNSTVVLDGVVTNPTNGAASALAVTAVNNSHALDMRVPRAMTWSFGAQRKLSKDSTLTLSYVGSSAANLSYQQDINQVPLGVGKTSFVPGTTTLANINFLRPYKGYSNIYQFNTGANYIYNSLQAQYQKRFGRTGSLSTAFTWARGKTDANAFNSTPRDSYDLKADYGASSYNRKFVLVPSWVYPLPFWQGGGNWYRQAFGGWQVNGTGQFQSGLPINPTISTDQGGTGNAGVQRPQLIGDPYKGDTVGGFQYLNKSAFALPAIGTFGNLGAYNIYLPRWVNVNASVSKSFFTRGRRDSELKWDLRFEVYNVANHLITSAINVGGYSGPAIVNWGQKTGTTPPRTMQATARLNF